MVFLGFITGVLVLEKGDSVLDGTEVGLHALLGWELIIFPVEKVNVSYSFDNFIALDKLKLSSDFVVFSRFWIAKGLGHDNFKTFYDLNSLAFFDGKALTCIKIRAQCDDSADVVLQDH